MSGGQVVGAKTRVPRIAGLARDRVDARLAQVWDHRLGLIVAPAGSGKTTLVSLFAAASERPVAWWRAEPSDCSEQDLVAHLGKAVAPIVSPRDGGWKTVEDVAAALDSLAQPGALLAVDDLHAIWGTEAEASLERLIGLLPAGVVVVAATRRLPGFNLSRMRVSGELLEIGPEDLRFRAWEVERLFRDFYGSPMPPEELAELARRTSGWAAGLQLFHLATRGKPAAERRRVLSQLGVRSRLLREYLARNVLDELPIHARDFLLRTCVLGRLDPSLCDELTGATSSDSVLQELERRQIFTTSVDDDGSYRYHEVLRSHLEAVLVEQVGEAQARFRFGEAAALLERHGFPADALRAYARAEDWEAVHRLVGGNRAELAERPGEWLDVLPAALVEHDPWLLLGTARRLLAQGRPEEALDAYARAEAAAGASQPGEVCRRERQALARWFSPAPLAAADWVSALRLATARDPLSVAADVGAGAEHALAAGVACLLGGELDLAARRLAAVADRPDASSTVAVAASIAALTAEALAGAPVAEQLLRAGEHAEGVGLAWLGTLARAAALADPGRPAGVGLGVLPKQDPWAVATARLLEGIGQLRSPLEDVDAVPYLTEALDGFRTLDAPVLEAWAAAALAAASGARGDARFAQEAARRAQVDLGLFEDKRPGAGRPAGEPKRHSGVDVRCLGSFEIAVDGATLDLTAVKPRVRTLLRFLALHAPAPVHRETLVESLWPDENDLRSGLRNLQVAMSALRQLLEPGVGRGAATIVVREGDSYRLAVPAEATDLGRFRAAVLLGRAARVRGDTADAFAAFVEAIELYRGDLLSDEGPAEWLLGERDRAKTEAADSALAAAELALDRGDGPGAAELAGAGLRIDPYRDALWRTLVRGHELAGNLVAARRAEARYAEVLRELGL